MATQSGILICFYLLKKSNTINYRDGHSSERVQRTLNLVANIRIRKTIIEK